MLSHCLETQFPGDAFAIGLVSKRHRDERGEQRRDLLGGAVILEGQIRKALRERRCVPNTACPDWRDTEARTHR